MKEFDFVLLALAVFYISFVVSSSEGPFQVFVYLRAKMPLGGLTACILCLAPWISLLMYLLWSLGFKELAYVFALAGASVFLWRWTGGAHV